MKRWRSIVAVMAVAIVLSPASAQQGAPVPGIAQDTDDLGEEIIVTGEIEETEPIVEIDASHATPIGSPRLLRGLVKRFFSCTGDIEAERLADVVDAKPNTLTAKRALDWMIRRRPACNPATAGLFVNPPGYGECNPALVDVLFVCQNFYYRAGVMDQVLRRFASDVTLTRKITFDPVVAQRFIDIEVPRNDARHPQDRKFFEVAACMVQHQPQLASRLADPSVEGAQRLRVQQRLIDEVPKCVGGAKRVIVDPVELRIYLAEAVYRWSVAARGVDSLVPRG